MGTWNVSKIFLRFNQTILGISRTFKTKTGFKSIEFNKNIKTFVDSLFKNFVIQNSWWNYKKKNIFFFNNNLLFHLICLFNLVFVCRATKFLNLIWQLLNTVNVSSCRPGTISQRFWRYGIILWKQITKQPTVTSSTMTSLTSPDRLSSLLPNSSFILKSKKLLSAKILQVSGTFFKIFIILLKIIDFYIYFYLLNIF